MSGAPHTLADVVRAHADATPDEIALVEPAAPGGRLTWTWRRFEDEVEAAARAWVDRGLEPGAAVGIDAANSAAWLRAYLGALRAALVVVPINPGLTDAETNALAALCSVQVVLCDRDRTLEIETITPDALVPVSDPAAPLERDVDGEDIAVLIATAGSTGEAKAVRLSHRALLAHCRNTVGAGVPGPDAVALAMLPLFHIFGLNAIAGTAVYAGARLVLVAGLPDDLPAVIAAEGVTDLPLTPSVLYRLVQDDDGTLGASLASVRSLVSGGAPLAGALAEEVRSRTGHRVEQGYGMTETSPGITTSAGTADIERPPGFVGRMLPGVELRVGDGSDDTRPAELHVRGENLFSGYLPDIGLGRTTTAGSPPATSATARARTSTWSTGRGN